MTAFSRMGFRRALCWLARDFFAVLPQSRRRWPLPEVFTRLEVRFLQPDHVNCSGIWSCAVLPSMTLSAWERGRFCLARVEFFSDCGMKAPSFKARRATNDVCADMGAPLDTNKELNTVGWSNVVSGLTGGFTGRYVLIPRVLCRLTFSPVTQYVGQEVLRVAILDSALL